MVPRSQLSLPMSYGVSDFLPNISLTSDYNFTATVEKEFDDVAKVKRSDRHHANFMKVSPCSKRDLAKNRTKIVKDYWERS